VPTLVEIPVKPTSKYARFIDRDQVREIHLYHDYSQVVAYLGSKRVTIKTSGKKQAQDVFKQLTGGG